MKKSLFRVLFFSYAAILPVIAAAGKCTADDTDPDLVYFESETDEETCFEDAYDDINSDTDEYLEYDPEENAVCFEELPDQSMVSEEVPDESISSVEEEIFDTFSAESFFPEPETSGDSDLITENVLSSSSSAVYDPGMLPAFSGRSLRDIAGRYSQMLENYGTYISGNSSTYYKSSCSLVSPYRQGVLSSDTLSAMQAMTDFCRWLGGCNPLTKTGTAAVTLQKAALVRNFSYRREVRGTAEKPSDMSSVLWSEGASVIPDVLSHRASPDESILKMINTGYDKSGEYWNSLEDREILLDPKLSLIRFGYSGDTAVGAAKAYGNSAASPVTAWPAPGIMPSHVVDPAMSAWSISFGEESGLYFSDPSKLRVKVENLTYGTSYTCSPGNGRITIGENGFLAFRQPSDKGKGSYAGMLFRVTITGLQDLTGQERRTVSYKVEFVDILPYVSSDVTGFSFNFSKLILGTEYENAGNLAMAAAVLPDTVKVNAAGGALYEIPLSGRWKSDIKNRCFRNSADSSLLPDSVRDTHGILKNLTIPYEIRDNNSTRAMALDFSPDPSLIGDTLRVSVRRYDVGYDRTRIVKVMDRKSGSPYGKLWLDSATSASFAESSYSSYEHTFRVPSVTSGRAGVYIAVCYFSHFPLEEAYVTPPVTLRFSTPGIMYSLYRKTGWSAWYKDGSSPANSNCGSYAYAFRIKIHDNKNLDVRCSVLSGSSGWSSWAGGGAVSGRPSAVRRAPEAVKLRLSGKDADRYDIWYCAYASGFGWLGWTCNGKPAGTKCQGSVLCGIRVMLKKAGSGRPERVGKYSTSFIS